MPQIFQVLRCYKCSTFQVHQTKKSNKFACKICNEKQSIKRHYGIGIAKDCRMHVQKLNKMRGEKDETLEDVSDEDEKTNTLNITEDTLDTTVDTTDNVKKTSKWLSYIDKKNEETDNDESPFILETNNKNNKRWSRNNKYPNYKAKKNFASKRKHYNDIDENDVKDVIENNISQVENDSTKNVFGKRPAFEDGSDCRVENEVKSTSHHDMKIISNTSEFKDNSLPGFTNLNKIPKLETSKVDKSSKWAQFIERDENIAEENCDYKAVEIVSKHKQLLFSLCDESDIDDLLDI